MVGVEGDLEQEASVQGLQDRALLPELRNTAFLARRWHRAIRTVKERSAIARFKVVGEDAYFLAWTTTPWTLPSNVALCVNPDETYVKVKAADGIYLLSGRSAGRQRTRWLAQEEGVKAYEVLETI